MDNYGKGLPMDQTNSRNNGAGQPESIKNFKIVDGNERSVITMPFTNIQHQNPGMREVGGIHPSDKHGAAVHNSGSGMFGA